MNLYLHTVHKWRLTFAHQEKAIPSPKTNKRNSIKSLESSLFIVINRRRDGNQCTFVVFHTKQYVLCNHAKATLSIIELNIITI